MKKLFAFLLALVMLFALSATAMAEESKGSDDSASSLKALSWITARRGLQQTDLTGNFYQISDLDVDIWVPDLFKPVEEVSENVFCAFETENKGAAITVNHLSFDGDPDLEEVEKMAVDAGCESDGIFWLNDFHALVYENKAADSLSVLIMITDGGAMEFVFAPISNPDVYSMASLIMSTIQHHNLDVENVAHMIDADLNSFWGENRDVRYSDDDKSRSISVFMWEDGITSENIKDVDNWDQVKDSKINLADTYTAVLSEFGMDDVLLNLYYISADQDVNFLAIEGGEITYDVFADAAA